MDKKIDTEINQDFLEILGSKENSDPQIDQKILFITTDSWLAQLGSRKENSSFF